LGEGLFEEEEEIDIDKTVAGRRGRIDDRLKRDFAA